MWLRCGVVGAGGDEQRVAVRAVEEVVAKLGARRRRFDGSHTREYRGDDCCWCSCSSLVRANFQPLCSASGG